MKDECWSQFSDRDRPGRNLMVVVVVVVVIVLTGVEDELLGVSEGLEGVLVGGLAVTDPGEEAGVETGLVPAAHNPQQGEEDHTDHHQRHGETDPLTALLLLLLGLLLLAAGHVGPGQGDAGRSVAGEVEVCCVERGEHSGRARAGW